TAHGGGVVATPTPSGPVPSDVIMSLFGHLADLPPESMTNSIYSDPHVPKPSGSQDPKQGSDDTTPKPGWEDGGLPGFIARPGAQHGGFGGLLDRALDLDPSKSFTESWLDMIYGDSSPAHGRDDDGTGTKLARAGYSLAMSPVALEAMAVGELMDTIN